MTYPFSFHSFTLVLAAVLGASLTPTMNADSRNDDETKTERQRLWREIGPLFSPPEEYAGDPGDYPTPLRFEDGTPVETAAEWKERRAELLELWHGWMGEWPPVIEDPEVAVLSEKRREDFTQRRIRFQWTPNETTEGYLLLPDGEGPRPAVVVVYYEPESAVGKDRELRDYAYQLTRRGFVTLSIGTTEATEARTFALYHPDIDNAEVEPLSMLAYAAANAWHVLAAQPEVDPERIGITGHSFGGKWALFASCLYERFACAAWSDPGIVFEADRRSVNYWEPWYLGYHPPPWRERGLITEDNPAHGLYPKLLEKNRDLHELHALMAPRPFLVSGGSEDPVSRWQPLHHSIEVNRLLGYSGRVAMSNRPEHSPNEESNEQLYQFFEYFLMHNGIDLKQPE